jgi:hypothetical protein
MGLIPIFERLKWSTHFKVTITTLRVRFPPFKDKQKVNNKIYCLIIFRNSKTKILHIVKMQKSRNNSTLGQTIKIGLQHFNMTKL